MLNGATGVIRAAAIRHAQALSRWVSQVEAQQTADSAFREASLPPSPPAVIASLKFAYRTEDAAARNRVEAALSRWVEAVDVAGLGAHAHLACKLLLCHALLDAQPCDAPPHGLFCVHRSLSLREGLGFHYQAG